MSQVLNVESGRLINSTLSHNMRVTLGVVDTLAHGHIMEDAKRERKGHVEVETRVRRLRDLRVGNRVLVYRVVLHGVLNVGVDVGL